MKKTNVTPSEIPKKRTLPSVMPNTEISESTTTA